MPILSTRSRHWRCFNSPSVGGGGGFSSKTWRLRKILKSQCPSVFLFSIQSLYMGLCRMCAGLERLWQSVFFFYIGGGTLQNVCRRRVWQMRVCVFERDFAECVPDWRICGSLDVIAQVFERAVQLADVRVWVLLRGELQLRHVAHTLPPVTVHCHGLGLSACGWQKIS
jgi:hypothetical protein